MSTPPPIYVTEEDWARLLAEEAAIKALDAKVGALMLERTLRLAAIAQKLAALGLPMDRKLTRQPDGSIEMEPQMSLTGADDTTVSQRVLASYKAFNDWPWWHA